MKTRRRACANRWRSWSAVTTRPFPACWPARRRAHAMASADARRGTRSRRGFRPLRTTGDAAARSHTRGGAAPRCARARSVLGRAETGKHRVVARLGAELGFTLTPLVGMLQFAPGVSLFFRLRQDQPVAPPAW